MVMRGRSAHQGEDVMSYPVQVVIVDEDPASREFWQGWLEADGYRVAIASDGATVLAALQQAQTASDRDADA
jgi:CheY-like chemotaxis protein